MLWTLQRHNKVHKQKMDMTEPMAAHRPPHTATIFLDLLDIAICLCFCFSLNTRHPSSVVRRIAIDVDALLLFIYSIWESSIWSTGECLCLVVVYFSHFNLWKLIFFTSLYSRAVAFRVCIILLAYTHKLTHSLTQRKQQNYNWPSDWEQRWQQHGSNGDWMSIGHAQ